MIHDALRPINELELKKQIVSKLNACNIYYISTVTDLSASEVRRRSGLTPLELAEIDVALSERKLSFHPSAEKTRWELLKDIRENGAKDVLQNLHDSDTKGDLRATVFLGVLLRERVIEPPIKNYLHPHLAYFRRAKNAGSVWAANDLAVHIFHNWSDANQGDRQDALKLFRFAHEAGLSHGTYNLAVALACVTTRTDEVSELLASAFNRGIASAATIHEEWLTKYQTSK